MKKTEVKKISFCEKNHKYLFLSSIFFVPKKIICVFLVILWQLSFSVRALVLCQHFTSLNKFTIYYSILQSYYRTV
jgi:hypothetical protein